MMMAEHMPPSCPAAQLVAHAQPRRTTRRRKSGGRNVFDGVMAAVRSLPWHRSRATDRARLAARGCSGRQHEVTVRTAYAFDGASFAPAGHSVNTENGHRATQRWRPAFFVSIVASTAGRWQQRPVVAAAARRTAVYERFRRQPSAAPTGRVMPVVSRTKSGA